MNSFFDVMFLRWIRPGVIASILTLASVSPMFFQGDTARAAVASKVLINNPAAGFLTECPPETDPDPDVSNFPSGEVEPWAAVNPSNPNNLLVGWQQDRWSNAGANGLLGGVSFDGGTTWKQTSATFTHCTGGNAANNGDYERATDPWVTFSPDGTGYFMSLSFNGTNQVHEMAVARSTNGGQTWSTPVTLRKDNQATIINDKNSITADPGDSSFVYAVWDRLVFPNEKARGKHADRAVGFYGPTWFARTTNGGQTWEPARKIYDPATDGPGAGRNDQTIGNQIVVLPNGDLINVFNLIHNDNAHKRKGFKVALIRSKDKGETWDQSATIVSQLGTVGVRDPNTGAPVRTGDINPEVAVDRSNNEATNGNLYIVWQDARFSGGDHDEIAFSRSTDGGHTWSTPKVISTPSGKPAFTPAIAVASDGTIGVTYYDFRNDDTDASLDTDVWIITSHDGGDTWNEQQVGDSFDMTKAPITRARGFFVGDYIAQPVSGTTFHPVWIEAGPEPGKTNVYTTKVTAP